MFGKLLSTVIKVVTLPVDAANVVGDIVTGGDGSKRSRNASDNCSPFALTEQIRDKVADAAEEIDD